MHDESQLRCISFGGGVQSTALVILAAHRHPAFEKAMGGRVQDAVFANVGEDSEHPAVLPWIRNKVQPWAAERGVTIHEAFRVKEDGERRTLLEELKSSYLSVPIPVRASNGAPGRRSCTKDFKINVVETWLRDKGVTKENPAAVAIGFTTDEIERAGRGGKSKARQQKRYPLLDMGWDRDRAQALNVKIFGSPAPKSSCWFCPFNTVGVWTEMRREDPNTFWQAVELEELLNKRKREQGKEPVWLARAAKPLDQAIRQTSNAPSYDKEDNTIGEQGCDEGACFT
jgi:hypothetical protein